MKKSYQVKMATMLAAVLLVSGIATACSSSNGGSANTNETASGQANGTKVASTEAVKLKVWTPLNVNASAVVKSLDDVEMVQQWQTKMNVDFEFEHPTNTSNDDVKQQFGVMLASGDLPDVIIWNFASLDGGLSKLYNDGTIIKLNDLIDQYAPNLKKILDEYPLVAKQIKADNGDIYAIPHLRVGEYGKYKTFAGQFIRQDWLDELSLQQPETIAEWEAVMKTIKEKKGVIPYTSEKNTLLGSKESYDFMGAYGLGRDFYVDNGTIKYPLLEIAFKDYLIQMNQWYKEGLIDPDYATNDLKAKEAKITSGKAAATFGYIGGNLGAWLPALQQSDANAMLSGVQYPVLNKGEEPKHTVTSWDYDLNGAVITSADKHPEETIKALDYLFSEEGALLKNFGIEGETYTNVDGQPVFSDLIMKNPDQLPLGQAMAKYFIANYPFPGLDDDRYNEQYYALDAQKEAVKTYTKFADNAYDVMVPPVTMTTEESAEFSTIMTDVNTYRNEIVTKIIMGSTSIDEHDNVVAQLKKMGIDRAVEIQQAALDRFNKR